MISHVYFELEKHLIWITDKYVMYVFKKKEEKRKKKLCKFEFSGQGKGG